MVNWLVVIKCVLCVYGILNYCMTWFSDNKNGSDRVKGYDIFFVCFICRERDRNMTNCQNFAFP